MDRTLTALITGASSGIGLELATIFAKNQTNLVLISRNKSDLEKIKVTLEKVYDVNVYIYACDLAKPDCAQQIYEVMSNEGIEINYLINNAGFGDYGEFIDSDAGKNYDMMMLNMVTLTEMTHLFLPAMKDHEFGRILNVASTAAFQPGPLMSVYYATKAFVLSFSEGISQELQGSGVTVTVLCPGPTETRFQKTAKLESSKLFNSVNVMDAQIVAQAGYEAMQDGQVILIPGFVNNAFTILLRFLPRFIVRKMVFNLQKKA
ncbi:MAG: SDR family oxidoreductase [candidate division SR1 bacterium]|nr:SDR family oxidoreductase [candidate division SR1 bacterium]